ncbi:hypothetical protein [Paenibacillus rhizophilus]|uniref:Uncharacterized protein n=1 Tax=Paenibacillus rhizophilus TaxID=1850366 RepID=A0A3N9P2R8_9BACL|nr:hypothetical protein [Paenibacillus rhizophilus]RQW10029.1 hypothetical protein EH198_16475 [Paenibacillus rhizophilus]
MSERLISADKLLKAMKDRVNVLLRDADPGYDVHPVVNALENYIERIESGTFDPTPVQPDIKPGDKVRHKDHPEYGEGKVRTKRNELNEVYVTFYRTQAHFGLDKLEVIHNGD